MTPIVTYIQKLGVLENELVSTFRKDTVLSSLDMLTVQHFTDILLQRRLLVLESFERMYNHAICAFSDDNLKVICRKIVLDEYPLDAPTHREDAVYDLERCGLDRATILSSSLTAVTSRAVEKVIDLVRYNHYTQHFDIAAMSALRMYETFAGEEAELLFSALQIKYGLLKEESHYFWPHVLHDKKRVSLGEQGDTHADSFGLMFVSLIDTAEKFSVAQDAFCSMAMVRQEFYGQFS